jgi:nitric oxide dioxygenase
MPVFLSQTTIASVKATIPALEAHGVTITQQMYDRIFEDPAIRALFDKPLHDVTRSQPVALANAIVAYAKNIDNLGRLQSLWSGSRKSTFARVSCQRITKWWRKH